MSSTMKGVSEMEERGSEHYRVGGVEVLDVLQAKMTKEQYEGFLLGNIIKYALRYNFAEKKFSDMEKCFHYCELLVSLRRREENTIGNAAPGPHAR